MSHDPAWEDHAEWWIELFTEGADPEYAEQIMPLAAQEVAERAATASSLAELLSINALDAPGGDVSHVQLTTGDAGRFGTIAARMFGDAFPDVETVELGVVAR